MNLRNLARKALTKTADTLKAADKRLEPSPGSKLRELIDDESIPTAAKFAALAEVQKMLKEIDHA